jgi:O-antigen ligase
MKKKNIKKSKEVFSPKPFLFYVFTGFLVLFIPVLHYPKALDEALMVRVLALSVFSLLFGIFLFTGSNYKKLDFSVLKQKIFLVMPAYLLITIISVLFAINYRESFFDVVRTFLWVAYAGYAAIIFSNTENWQDKLPKLVTIAALIALALGARQYYNDVIRATALTLPDGRSLTYAVYGLMFHKNEYSSALLLMLPFLAFGVYRLNGTWRILAAATALLVLIMIVLVQTRAVWVGIAVSMFITSIILVFFSRKLGFPAFLRNITAVGLVAGILGVIVIFSIEKPEDTGSVLGRIRSITDTRSQHNIHRLNIWKSTLKLAKENPLTGVGAGNWRLHIAYYFDGKFEEVSQLNWARPHNDYLWVLSEKGIIGLLIFMAVFGVTIFYLFKVLVRTPSIENKILALFLLAGVFAFLAVSFFNFPYERMNHQVYMAIIIGGAASLRYKLAPQQTFKPPQTNLLMVLIIFSAFGALYGYKTMQQESNLKYSISAMHHENWRTMLNYAQRAYNPFKSLDPLSNPPEYYEGMALAKLGRHHEALDAYAKARKQFPNNMWITNWMGQSYYQVGRFEDALACLDVVLHIIPTHREGHISRSATYFQMGEYQKSYDALKNIRGWEDDPAIQRNMRALENRMKQQAESRN